MTQHQIYQRLRELDAELVEGVRRSRAEAFERQDSERKQLQAICAAVGHVLVDTGIYGREQCAFCHYTEPREPTPMEKLEIAEAAGEPAQPEPNGA